MYHLKHNRMIEVKLAHTLSVCHVVAIHIRKMMMNWQPGNEEKKYRMCTEYYLKHNRMIEQAPTSNSKIIVPPQSSA